DLVHALASLQEKDLVVPSAGSRLAGEHEYAFKHALIRDVAYSTLPKAVCARKHAEVGAFIAERAADRSEGVVAMVAEHYGRAAALGADTDLEPSELERVNARAVEALEGAGDAAAALYMHTGDNMLAIYASEKALRIAERLGESAAASRAHGIFGRVFGRIGDSERARQNLERSVELARDSDPAEAVRALLTLGYHLEVSEADYDGAGTAYREALELAEQTGDLPSKVELHAALAQLAVHGGDWESVRSEADASGSLAEREGLTGKLCFPYMMRGMLRWREGDFDESAKALRRAADLAEQVGRSE